MKRSRILLASLMAIFALGTIAVIPVALAYDGLGSPVGPTLDRKSVV